MTEPESNPINLEVGVEEAQEIERKEGEALNDHVLKKIDNGQVDDVSDSIMPVIKPEHMMAQQAVESVLREPRFNFAQTKSSAKVMTFAESFQQEELEAEAD